MIESIFQTKSNVPINRTIIATSDDRQVVLGGAAINVSWYLSLLGKSVRLVAPIASRHVRDLSHELSNSLVDLNRLMRTKGDTDHLITILSPEGHRSVYTLGTIPTALKKTLLIESKAARVIILNGGRHQEVRNAFKGLVHRRSKHIVAFNPSYAIYEYSSDDLIDIIENCDICFLNEDEYRFAKKCATDKRLEYMPRLAFIVTRSSKGALMFSKGRRYAYKSLVDREGLFLGAGDGCLAGFLSGFLDNQSAEEAMQRGMRLAAHVVKGGTIRTKLKREDRSAILGRNLFS